MLLAILEWALILLGLAMLAGTLIGLSSHPHWFVRGWDFPRAQILALLLLAAAPYAALFYRGGWWGLAFLVATTAAAATQALHILPYTRLWPRRPVQKHTLPPGPHRFRMVMSNVRMENRDWDRWKRVVLARDPDIVLAVEVDAWWADRLATLRDQFPHAITHPQDNWYGMAVLSKLPLHEPAIEFLVQDDIPSMHAWVELRTGQRIMLHGLHPRPPEPLRKQDATPRDAELVIVGRHIGDEEDRPTVVAGDLNDVAWSRTTALFLRTSGLLDPRIGRGLYNSFNADSRFWRFPLDHVFHSNDFRLVDLRLLDHVGSDHFPVCIELSHEPDAEAAQPEPQERPGDAEEADEKIERQVEHEAEGKDPHGRL